MNFYPNQLLAIVRYVQALDGAEKDLEGDDLPFPKKVPMTDESGSDYGFLVDEVGGAWSWQVPSASS